MTVQKKNKLCSRSAWVSEWTSEKIPRHQVLPRSDGAAGQDQLRHYACLTECCYHRYYFTAHFFFLAQGFPSTVIYWTPGNLPCTWTELAFVCLCQRCTAVSVLVVPTHTYYIYMNLVFNQAVQFLEIFTSCLFSSFFHLWNIHF